MQRLEGFYRITPQPTMPTVLWAPRVNIGSWHVACEEGLLEASESGKWLAYPGFLVCTV
jgi:hypothetical protein